MPRRFDKHVQHLERHSDFWDKALGVADNALNAQKSLVELGEGAVDHIQDLVQSRKPTGWTKEPPPKPSENVKYTPSPQDIWLDHQLENVGNAIVDSVGEGPVGNFFKAIG